MRWTRRRITENDEPDHSSRSHETIQLLVLIVVQIETSEYSNESTAANYTSNDAFAATACWSWCEHSPESIANRTCWIVTSPGLPSRLESLCSTTHCVLRVFSITAWLAIASAKLMYIVRIPLVRSSVVSLYSFGLFPPPIYRLHRTGVIVLPRMSTVMNGP